MADGGKKRRLLRTIERSRAVDELGFRVAEDPVGIHDLQATILPILGLDHTRLTYRFQGRDYRRTDVYGEVVEGLLA